jgi:hypothetical protein
MGNVEILLKEYETLRSESLLAIQNRTSILTFGIATLGAMFSFALGAQKSVGSETLASLSLIFVVPVSAWLITSIWLGEYERMHRAGRFISKLEKRINEMANAELLTWEHTIRQGQLHMALPYYHTVILILLLGGAGMIVGLATIAWPIKVRLIIGFIGMAFHGILYMWLFKRMKRARD